MYYEQQRNKGNASIQTCLTLVGALVMMLWYSPTLALIAIGLPMLSFAYNDNKPVLNDVNIKFNAGGCYAIVGGSGSGKSTILNLLMASHRSYQGEICYDGNELRSVTANALRRCTGLVVLKNGAVTEQGTFDELMEKRGCFYSLFTVSQ